MQRVTKAASRLLRLAPALVVLPTLALATRGARAQAVAAPPAAAFPSTDAPPAPSDAEPAPAAPAAPASPAVPPSGAPSSPPAATAEAPSVRPAPVQPAPQPPPPPLSTGSAAFAPLPAATHAPTVKASKPPPAAPRRIPPASATPPFATGEPYHRGAPNAGAAESEPESEKAQGSNGVLGPIRIGFLIGTGLPDLLSLGGTIKLTQYLGLGLNIGIIPKVKLSLYGDATISYQEYDLYGRVYPFGGAFFLGSGLGYGTIKGTISNRYALTPEQSAASGLASPVQIDSAGSVRTLVLTPQLGFLKTFSSGFSIGVDAGAQIPIAPSKVDYQTHVPSGVPAQLVTPNDDKVRSTLDTIGRTTLPTINFKVGWLL